MKPICLFLYSLAILGSQALAQDASPRTINDQQIKSKFEKLLGELKDDEKTPDPKSIQKQLKQRKHYHVELPRTQSLLASSGTTDVYQKRLDSVLCFGYIYKCDHCNLWHGNIAGGFVITDDGVAVTNYHVMDAANAGAFGAMTVDGKMHYVEEVLAASKADDLAIVKLSGSGFTPAPLMIDAPTGSKVIAISHPQGRFYTLSEGIISRYYRVGKGKGVQRVAITADFAKGSSGSAVFSATGDVIGVVASTNSIYYKKNADGVDQNLQMVVKSCIPTRSIMNLLSKKPAAEKRVAAKVEKPKSEKVEAAPETTATESVEDETSSEN